MSSSNNKSNSIPESLWHKNASDFASYSESVETTDWKGDGIDILLAYLYLHNKNYRDAKIEFPHENLTLEDKDMMWKLVVRYSCYQKGHKFKITFPGGEANYFQFIRDKINKDSYLKNKSMSVRKTVSGKSSRTKKVNRGKKLFIGSGVFLGSKSCSIKQGHYNMLILDTERMTLERMEPYGRSYSDSKLETDFDLQLEKIYRKHGFTKIKVIPPSKFMSSKSFQWLEENYQLQKSIGEEKPDDPPGFCGGWATFLTDLRLKYPRVNTKKLIKIPEKKIFGKKILRNYIRNTAQHYVKTGKKLLDQSVIKSSISERAEELLQSIR